MKTFQIFLEEQEDKKKVKTMLLSRLGFTKNVLDDQIIKINDIDRQRLQQAINSMGLEDDNSSQLLNWVKMYPHSTLQELLTQLDDMEINLNDKEQSSLVSNPAEIPQGEPMPQKQQKQPQQNQFAQ